MRHLLLLCTFALTTACLEKKLHLDDYGEPVPVINGLITHGEEPVIHFYYSIPSAGPASLTPLQGARIQLYEDGVLWDSLFYDTTLEAYTCTKLIQEGKAYSLQLQYKDQELTAYTRVPTPPVLEIMDTLYLKDDLPRSVDFQASIKIIKPGDGVVFNKPTQVPRYIIHDNGMITDKSSTTYVISDFNSEQVVFAGQAFTLIDINEALNAPSLKFTTDQTIIRTQFQHLTWDSTIFVLESLSEEYYKYIQMPPQAAQEGLDVVEDYPVTYTNVEGGAGLFAGYSKGSVGIKHQFIYR